MGSIEINSLGKAYKVYPSRFARLREWLFPFGKPQHTLKWILRDVTIQIKSGEAVGIVGVNGAGKSTLLKMLTGTTQPTLGKVEIHGSVAALLELGMGFHPEFTGRQNVYMAGQLLGMTVSEINDLMPQIEGFAEIGDYIDQPLRVYSSGMSVRLAFSLATAKRPDILIVDEALAVGDAQFQHKCFSRIKEFKDRGTTLLFVSHAPLTVKSLCNRAILLDSHCVAMDDTPEKVFEHYNALLAKREGGVVLQNSPIVEIEDLIKNDPVNDLEASESKVVDGTQGTRSGNKKAKISSVKLLVDDMSTLMIRSCEPAKIRIDYEVAEALPELTVGILIRDKLGNDIFGTNSYIEKFDAPGRDELGKKSITFNFPSLALGTGNFRLTVALHAGYSRMQEDYDWWDRALVFDVLPGVEPQKAGCCVLPVLLTS